MPQGSAIISSHGCASWAAGCMGLIELFHPANVCLSEPCPAWSIIQNACSIVKWAFSPMLLLHIASSPKFMINDIMACVYCPR